VTEIQRLTPDLSGRQTAWLVIGMTAFIVVLAGLRDHHVLERYQYLIGAGGVLALIITVSPLGHEVNGSRLWINFGPVNIQPGEFAKLAIVIFLAGYLAANREVLGRGVSLRPVPLVRTVPCSNVSYQLCSFSNSPRISSTTG